MPHDDDRPEPDYAAGLPDHHDPTAGIGGAPRAVSALTLRMVLAGLAVVLVGGGAVAVAALGGDALSVVGLAVVAVLAVVNLVVVARRKRRGEPG